MNSNRITELLNLYLDGMASPEERDELMQLIREGSYDETIRDSIHAMLSDARMQEDIDPRKAHEMLKGILTTAEKEAKIVPLGAVTGNWRWAAVAAMLITSLSIGWWTFKSLPASEQFEMPRENNPEPVVFTGKQFLRLPDGSTVLLNVGSELSYTVSFGEQSREVTLIGEGYFDVLRDPSKPFKVLTGRVTTTVLGTAFNVKAYPGQPEIKVTVTRGKVRVGDDRRTFGVITPDQQLAVNTTTNHFVHTTLKAEQAAEWKSQFLILDNVSLEQAAITIADKYKVEIRLANNELKRCRISATFLDGENLDQVLTVVSGVVKATYTTQPDGTIRIEGKGCE